MFIRLSPHRTRLGAIMVDFVMTMLIGSLISAVVASILIVSNRSFAAMLNYFELENQSRQALDEITTEVRQANKLLYGDEWILMFEELDGDPLYYIYSGGDDGYLYKIKDWYVYEMLEGVQELEFSLYQRNPVDGSYDQYPTANAETCKLVEMNWKCSRKMLGLELQTESIQTSKVVIRRQ